MESFVSAKSSVTDMFADRQIQDDSQDIDDSLLVSEASVSGSDPTVTPRDISPIKELKGPDRKTSITMKEFLKLHLDYPKSNLEYNPRLSYDNNCSCPPRLIVKRKPRKCSIVKMDLRLLECRLCGGIFKASDVEFVMFKMYYKQLVYNKCSNNYKIIDKDKYPRITRY